MMPFRTPGNSQDSLTSSTSCAAKYAEGGRSGMKRVPILFLILIILAPSVSIAREVDGAHLLQQRYQRLNRRLSRTRIPPKVQKVEKPEVVRVMRGLRALRESVRRQRHKNSAVILRALQGDVFDARLVDGTNTGIRLLGIDAPDIIRPENDIECYSNISRSAASSFLVKKRVELEKSSDYQRDSFGRLVRYVRFGSQDASAWMIWNGFAFADREHEHRRQSRYLSLELSAREAKRGLWSHKCEYNKLIDVFPIQ